MRYGLYQTILSPVFIVLLFLLVYGFIGTSYRLMDKNFYYVGRNFEDIMHWGILSALVFLVSFLFGYGNDRSIKKQLRRSFRECYICDKEVDFIFYRKAGIYLISIGYCSLFAWLGLRGGRLSVVYSSEQDYLVNSSVSEGFDFLIVPFNLVIPGTLLLHMTRYRLRIISVLAYLLFSVSLGFRYRIVVMLLAVFALTSIQSKSSKKLYKRLLIIGVIGAPVIVIMALTRKYTRGLDLSQLGDYSDSWQVIGAVLSDTNILMGVSSVIEYCMNHNYYLYLDPILYAFAIFIPRKVWPDKPAPGNFDLIVAAIGTKESAAAGTAVPVWGEMFMSFGWFGVFFGSYALGYIARRMHFLVYGIKNKSTTNMIDAVIYSAFYGYLYLFLSRGYLAQVMPEFMVIVFPLILLRKINSFKRKQ